MALLVGSLVRAGALGVLVLLYLWLVVARTSVGDDALGAGLLAFLLVVVVALVWGTVDGRAHGAGRATLLWAASSAVFAVGWFVAGSLTTGTDLLVVPFIFLLTFVPASTGCGVGHLLRPWRR